MISPLKVSMLVSDKMLKPPSSSGFILVNHASVYRIIRSVSNFGSFCTVLMYYTNLVC